MSKKADVIGSRVQMLEAVERLPGSRVRCKCDCGGERVVHIGHFNAGYFKSCGCHVSRHGHAKNQTREYVCYRNMLARCHNPKNKRYGDYGEKGIVVCERWRGSFQRFLDDMGECPPGMQIDRVDNNLGYSPDNCRWATPKANMDNRGCTRVWTVFGSEYLSTADAARAHGVSPSTIRAWCMGRMAEGRWYDPRPGCTWRWKYDDPRKEDFTP